MSKTKQVAAQRQSGAVSAVPEAEPSRNLTIIADPTMTRQEQIVAATLCPSVNAGMMFTELTHKDGGLDLGEMSRYLKDAAATAAAGVLSPLQQMLAIQARALDQIFYHFARRAGDCTTLDARETCLRLAMKAQSQSRTTVETLAAIQQGPAIFAKNANINNGQQQVNHGSPSQASTRAKPAPVLAAQAIEASKATHSVPVVSGSARTALRARAEKFNRAERTNGGTDA